MKLQLFNATEKELEERPYNVFIGISVGIKPFTKELAKQWIEWSLKHTKEKVAILVADEIAKINYRILSGYSEGKSQKRALRDGDEYVDFFEELLKDFSKDEQEKVSIVRWKDIFTEKLQTIKEILDQEFDINPKFREQILEFLRRYVGRRKKELSEEKLTFLAQYILFELPTLLEGIQYKGTEYRLLLYPTYVGSGMSEFVTDIQNGRKFRALRDKLKLKEKTVMVEAYIQ